MTFESLDYDLFLNRTVHILIYFTVLFQAIIGMHRGSKLMAVTFDALKQPL